MEKTIPIAKQNDCSGSIYHGPITNKLRLLWLKCITGLSLLNIPAAGNRQSGK